MTVSITNTLQGSHHKISWRFAVSPRFEIYELFYVHVVWQWKNVFELSPKPTVLWGQIRLKLEPLPISFPPTHSPLALPAPPPHTPTHSPTLPPPSLHLRRTACPSRLGTCRTETLPLCSPLFSRHPSTAPHTPPVFPPSLLSAPSVSPLSSPSSPPLTPPSPPFTPYPISILKGTIAGILSGQNLFSHYFPSTCVPAVLFHPIAFGEPCLPLLAYLA